MPLSTSTNRCSHNIICMKWGEKYGPEYVNRLYNGIDRHLCAPFQLTCFTDNASGIDPRVIIRPMPCSKLDISSMDAKNGGETWRKVMLYMPSLLDDHLHDQDILFLDLDIVILSDLKQFFTYEPGKFCLIHDWLDKMRGRDVGNTSIVRFRPSSHQDIYHHYHANQKEMLNNFRIEQQYVTWAAKTLCGDAVYWPAPWAQSYKRSCRRVFPLNYFLKPHKPPSGCSMLVFHGYPTPSQAISGFGSGWKKCLPVDWLQEHWK